MSHLTFAARMKRAQSLSIEGDRSFVLGIDVGTTSVKVSAVDTATLEVVVEQTKDTQANVPSEFGTEGNKQDVPKIVSTLHACISRMPKELLKRVVYIGICGQMHGVLLWKSGSAWEWESSGDKVLSSQTSNLYTWQDSRCSKEFIASLPKPDSHLSVSSGYGTATLFWMSKYKKEKLEHFDRAGTIQDFIVAMLCNLDAPVMSVQNAASWGYFNTLEKSWNIDILQSASFPLQFLPRVVEAGELAGKTFANWHGIPERTPVGAALGDFQCSVYSTIKTDSAVLNISTSAQLAYILKRDLASELRLCERSGHIEYFPYFGGKYLAVAAALTGGNALAAFVKMLQLWAHDLGCNVPQSKIWEKILESGTSQSNTKSPLPVITPTIFGERFAPDIKGSITNVDLGNIGLGQVTRALCRGIVKNLHDMMPKSLLEEAGVKKVIGSGTALTRNQTLQEEFAEMFGIPTELSAHGDSAYGAALVMIKKSKLRILSHSHSHS